MTVPTHFRHVVRGKFLGSSEIWSYGLHFERNVEQGPDAGLDAINTGAVDSALSAFFANMPFSNQVEVTDYRFYTIGADGKMEGNGPLIREYAPGDLKGTGTRVLPPQVALVVSKVADNRGPAQFGRFYLPASGVTVTPADGRISSTQAEAWMNLCVAYLKGISGAIDLPGTLASSDCVNISRKPAPDGTLQSVDHLRIGLALDTLRTRRNALKEDYFEGGQIDW